MGEGVVVYFFSHAISTMSLHHGQSELFIVSRPIVHGVCGSRDKTSSCMGGCGDPCVYNDGMSSNLTS